MKYRAEIDGLRALAVVPVILFHAGFELFSGGFVGVDVFFVISGYLITTIILEDVEKKQFSIARFYERRARRIMPALFTVMVFSLLAAIALLGPNAMAKFGLSLTATSLFFGNIIAWRQTGQYFSGNSELMPLLNTWSLAVEEQFYIVFPFVLLFLLKNVASGTVFRLLMLFSFISLLVAIWGSIYESGANYYLTPTRVWELFFGALAALYIFHHRVEKNNGLAALGLILIACSVMFYDSNVQFPSHYTLLPVVGTLLIILYAHGSTNVARMLSLKPLVAAGLVSYSAYLWHQPVFAFYRIYIGNLDIPPFDITVLLILLVLISIASYRFIEQPFRDTTKVKRRTLWYFFAFAVVMPAMTGMVIYMNNGFDNRLSEYEVLNQNKAFENHINELREVNCKSKNNAISYCQGDSPPELFVYGDSHALALSRGLIQQRIGHYNAANGGCPPLFGVDIVNGEQTKGGCLGHNDSVFEFLSTQANIKTVFLVGRWTLYTSGDYGADMKGYFLSDSDFVPHQESSRLAFSNAFSRTVQKLRALDLEVVVVMQAPQHQIPVMEMIESSLIRGEDTSEIQAKVSVKLQDYHSLAAFYRSVFQSFEHREGVQFVAIDDLFCSGNPRQCYALLDNDILYLDDDHLSGAGAVRITKKLVQLGLLPDTSGITQ